MPPGARCHPVDIRLDIRFSNPLRNSGIFNTEPGRLYNYQPNQPANTQHNCVVVDKCDASKTEKKQQSFNSKHHVVIGAFYFT